MVSPILLVALPLAISFLLPLFDRLGRGTARAVQLTTILAILGLSIFFTLSILQGAPAYEITTGGWEPPLGINLRFGLIEGLLISLAGLVSFGAALFLEKREEDKDVRSLILQVMLLAGSIGLIMTRDIFNIFVFLEITSIATYGIVALGKEEGSLEAGFKYLVMGSIASTFILLAIGLLYKMTGTLNLDGMIEALPAYSTPILGTILLMLLVGMAAELKLFPLNGPGIDLYDGVEPGVMALLVGTTVNAVIFVFWKMLPLFPAAEWTPVIMSGGMATFVTANLLAIRQRRVGRMLGYSSSAQIGLLVFLMPLVALKIVPIMALGLLLLNHTVAKAGMLFLLGAHGDSKMSSWAGAFAKRGGMRMLTIAFVVAITGLPPFPGFFGKWQALEGMASSPYAWWIIPLLIGSLLEFVYYFGWLKEMAGEPKESEPECAKLDVLPALVLGALGLGVGSWVMVAATPSIHLLLLMLFGFGLLLLALSKLPTTVLGSLSFFLFAYTAYRLFVQGALDMGTVSGFFAILVIFGALIVSLAAIGPHAPKGSYHGLFVMLVASVLLVVRANSLLVFFVAWEVMTWVSWKLIAQGKKGARPAWIYMIFSGAAGFLVFGGLLVAMSQGVHTFTEFSRLSGNPALLAFGLLAVGLLMKMASVGAHIFAPDAYSESPDIFTPFLSGVVSKIPIFVLALVLGKIGLSALDASWIVFDPLRAVAWVGGLSALVLTFIAVFQEDMKKLLAYSSLGQVGYIVAGLAIMSPLGWSAAFFHAANHFLFKALLFLSVAGVIYRTGTRLMGDMGGLVRKMPISFISMLIGIIALAGVPPLSGFSGKWLIYHALMDKGWYFLLAMLMFSSMIAFLYLYRIIHSVFLGQLKKKHENVKEAPIALIAAQMILMVVIMGVSVFPGVLISPLQGVISSRFGDTGLSLESLSFLGSKWGFFDAMGMMSFTVMIFVLLGLVLATFLPRTTKVKQLDMVFAGEIPPPPEELHYSVDMYQPFERAFEPVMNSHVKSFWKGVANWTQAVADILRRLYSGNGQTYLIYAVALVVILGALWTGIGASKSTAKVLDANQKSAVAASAIVDAVEEKRR